MDDRRAAEILGGKNTPNNPVQPAVFLRLGTVTGIASDGTLTITLGGDSTAIPGVFTLPSYAPWVGDNVWVAVNGTDLLVIGSDNPVQVKGRNLVHNGRFAIAQRGVSGAGSTAGTNAAFAGPDRWRIHRSTFVTGLTWSVATTGGPPGVGTYLRIQRTAADVSVLELRADQGVESVDFLPLVGATIVVSFYARAGANLSAPLSARFITGTGVEEILAAAYTGAVVSGQLDVTPPSATTWTRYAFTVAVPASATEATLRFQWLPTGTAGAADYVDISGVQVESGGLTPCEVEPYPVALAKCQRFYYRINGGATNQRVATSGYANTTVACACHTLFPVPMRVAPTALDWQGTAGNYSVAAAGPTARPVTATPVLAPVTSTAQAQTTWAFTTATTVGAFCEVYATSATAIWLGFSADL
jgi:hypothetical protein